MTPLGLALREIRHRKAHAAIFVLSLGFGAASLMALSGFGAAVERTLKDQARELWAADIAVRGSQTLLDRLEPWARARWPGLAAARTVDTLSMVRRPGKDRTAQVRLSAVTPNYPLHGRIQTSSGRPLSQVLTPGRLVAAPKLLHELDARVGDLLRVGTSDLRVADVIASRTDAPTSFFEFAPSLLITPADLDASGLLSPGSRAWNVLYLNLPPGAAPDQALAEVRAHAADETAEVSSWSTDNPGLLKFLRNTLLYLDFLGLLTLAIGGVGVAGALAAALAASTRSLGMVLALGAPRSYLAKAWFLWVVLLTTAGLGLALLLGHGLAHLLVRLFGDLLPPGLSLGFPWAAFLRAGGVGFSTSLLFTALPLLKLTRLPPNAVLRNQADPPPGPVLFRGPLPARLRQPETWASSCLVLLCAAGFYLIVLSEMQKPLPALYGLAGLAGGLGLSWALVSLGLGPLRRILLLSRSTALRLAARGLRRPGNLNAAGVVAVALSLAVILTLLLLEKNLTAQWIRSFPPDAPNVFFINVQKDQIEAFRRVLGNRPVRLFPLIRGRVIEVNGRPVRDIQDRAEARRGHGDRLTREFGFTFGEDLLPTDRVVAGPGLWDDRMPGPQVSVFEEYHERFGINVGDEITVNVLGRRFTARVSSLRAIDESARQPFFYFYFRPGLLDPSPHTFMGGLHLPTAEIPDLENRLAERLPNVTVIDLSEVAALTGRIMGRLTRVVDSLGLFGVFSGLLLLVSGLWTTWLARVRESVLYRTLGARTSQVAGIYLLEYGLMAGVGGLAAWAVGSVAAWAILRFGFRMPFFAYPVWAAGLLGSAALLMAALSWASTRGALRAAPMEVLRYE